MRIVGGKFKGRKISAPTGQNTRPTTDRVRESLFNILTHHNEVIIDGARVLDLYAGSGALGFEAISRGAAFGLFVDTDPGARGAIRQNIEALSLFGETRIHRRSAQALGKKPAGVGPPFSLVFMDPPYRQDLVIPTLTTLSAGAWLDEGAWLVVEHERDAFDQLPTDYSCDKKRSFGETELSLLSYRRG